MTARELASKISGHFETGSPIAAGKPKGKPYQEPAGGFTAAAERIQLTAETLEAELGASYSWVYAMLCGLALESCSEGFGPNAAFWKIRDAKLTGDDFWPMGEEPRSVYARLELAGAVTRGKGSLGIVALKPGVKIVAGAAAADSVSVRSLAEGIRQRVTVTTPEPAAAVAAVRGAAAAAAERREPAAVSREFLTAYLASLTTAERRALGLPVTAEAERAERRAVTAAEAEAKRAEATAAAAAVTEARAMLAEAERRLAVTAGATVKARRKAVTIRTTTPTA